MKKILIVEDDNFISEMYANKLTQAGYEIRIAKDGLEALGTLKEGKFDLVLLDIVLPRMDGYEVLKSIKKDPSLVDAKVAFLTNLGQPEEIKKGLKSEADAYIIKAHSTPSEVVEKVGEILGE